jgi:hypothetical protein
MRLVDTTTVYIAILGSRARLLWIPAHMEGDNCNLHQHEFVRNCANFRKAPDSEAVHSTK